MKSKAGIRKIISEPGSFAACTQITFTVAIRTMLIADNIPPNPSHRQAMRKPICAMWRMRMGTVFEFLNI